MADFYFGADFEDESLHCAEDGRKLNFRTEINHVSGETVHGMICKENEELKPWGVQLYT